MTTHGDNAGGASPAAPAKQALPAELANHVQQEIVNLIRAMAGEAVAHVEPAGEPLDVTLHLLLDPRNAWQPAQRHRHIYRQLREAIEEFGAQTDAFQRGRVFCYRCRSAQCEHSAPPSAAAVFAAYSQTGVPEWKDLHQYLLDAGDERVDQLFGERGRVLSRGALGREVKAHLFPSFGKFSKSYNILGQVVAGYYAVEDAFGMREKTAVTVQIVECRGPGAVFRLEANVIGAAPDGEPVIDAMLRGVLPDVTRAYQIAARDARAMEQKVRAARLAFSNADPYRALRQIPAVLSRVAASLERSHRQGARRTVHAHQRKEDRRPVNCAMQDAQDAQPAAVFRDEKNDTIIIRGPRNRVHAFSTDARHVTSFTLRDEQVDRRVRLKHWRPAAEDEVTAFRAALAAHSAAGQAQEEEPASTSGG
ncbi:hypothetical protein GX586_16105 [bacterium]|nr:hypothetical protein [bacterium]